MASLEFNIVRSYKRKSACSGRCIPIRRVHCTISKADDEIMEALAAADSSVYFGDIFTQAGNIILDPALNSAAFIWVGEAEYSASCCVAAEINK